MQQRPRPIRSIKALNMGQLDAIAEISIWRFGLFRKNLFEASKKIEFIVKDLYLA